MDDNPVMIDVEYLEDLGGDEMNSSFGYNPAGQVGDVFELPAELAERMISAGMARDLNAAEEPGDNDAPEADSDED